eukprot:9842839-Alexandrium_andersonii.AAC.1
MQGRTAASTKGRGPGAKKASWMPESRELDSTHAARSLPKTKPAASGERSAKAPSRMAKSFTAIRRERP